MDFFDKTGKVAIGSRLRLFTEMITKDASLIYKLYGVDIKPKWFPVFFVLSQGEFKTVTGIAKVIGHSHPSVSNIVKEMKSKGLVKELKDNTDKRRCVIALSEKGRLISDILEEQCMDVATAIEKLSEEARNDLWRAIEEWEYLLSKKSLFQRVKEEKRLREGKDISIVPYSSCYQPIFKALNEEWITSHWQMEEADYRVLNHPQECILDRGGYIFVALYKHEPVGVCALCKSENSVYDYELAKYAVSPKVQGKGIGFLLGKTVIDKAIEMGAKKIFLESNTLLRAALHIYRKLGFKELNEYRPAYVRGDIQMELVLD